ncbi:NADH:flavin oxidoreductase [Falsochrobactrum shanghaiense]|uniref:NADH:flavin oxidoreductase n=1 Tax=Falsochrobactrum shanghaiense TaxID=2201899 RepID=A0A316J6F2_9HYPH|nr:NADH:flavin oxidoreductase [Falsochrobactrum shanghaiense]PWL16345.1 NADH:flavin oxidoreductase [Falsochrobactrum shanghaiense]
MSTNASAFFTQTDINTLTLHNRLAVAPMTRVSAAKDGTATAAMQRYYERFAMGGFGLLITEGLYTDQAFSQGYHHQPGVSDEAQARSWKPVVDAVHEHDARIFAQIMHSGALSYANRFRNGTVGPSAVKPKGKQSELYYGEGEFVIPRAMTEEEIADAIAGFAIAAERAVSIAGFDGIELHGANGYLIDQFLTDYTNSRTDRWGGSTQRRTEFLIAVFKAVREKIGDAVPLGARISQAKVNDFVHKWQGRDADAEIIFGSLADAGADFIHVTEFEAWQPAFDGGRESLAALARRFAPGAAIIANGGLHDLARAAQMIDQGVDVIAIGRGALANPDLPRRAAAARELAVFDSGILAPIANIKQHELEMA